ncbi:hypothetical protein P8625_09410 [Tenacibaculum tangerinum]|uniref:Uncharacterized protein n=1 Tax=Tenacibaculum tangerinum TaxID=3038772 RepID=A0ABY8KYL7_9FLAO|nr:hypothetical protein [Tenacibaculum tangerinum]WGH74332.1 hypothetical protein P8625_09410 [Tenacibaculum tangerinum]
MKKLLQRFFAFVCPKPEDPTQPKTLLTYTKIINMLREYDNRRRKLIVESLGFEDTRMNIFDFEEFKNYMLYTEKVANEKGIKLKGISFIKGVYNEETAHDTRFVNYENLLYTPTAIVNGKEVPIDILKSTSNHIVTLQEILEKHGYEWTYDSKEELQKQVQKQAFKAMVLTENTDDLSGVGNLSHIKPPKA